MSTQAKPLIVQAVEALQAGRRDSAVALMQRELQEGPRSGERFRSFTKLAGRIGEIDLALEGARRFAATQPVTLERVLFYLGELVENGRRDQIRSVLGGLPAQVRQHPSIHHFNGTVASQDGDFAAAERHYRAAISQAAVPQTWFALAMIKKFTPSDPDIAAMEALIPTIAHVDANARAAFYYGLAKAYDDCGQVERAFELYLEGAELRRQQRQYDPAENEAFVDRTLSDFTPQNLARLTPSGETTSRAIFVNGLPRSGTTLVEQILASHSDVHDGGEINLFRAALTSVAGPDLSRALQYQEQHGGPDPWGDLARSYHQLLQMRFGAEGRIVDKTLLQSRFMGLLLHSLPEARVVWLRRNPADCALSCLRTYFTSDIPWSWSLADIGHFFGQEDRLFIHWTAIFPDRILVVPYEDLVADPVSWISRIAAHVGLDEQEAMQRSHQAKRSVRTASVQQVRSPINTAAVGKADRYRALMGAFFAAYSQS